MRDVDIAWFAGLFEGEGCFETTKRSTVRLTIAMTDRDIIERVNALFPGTVGVRPDRRPVKPHYNQPRDIYAWRIGRAEDVARIINLMLPWLGERRRSRALEALGHIASRPEPGTSGKTHCKNGHPLVPENLMPRSGSANYRRCRTCYKAYQDAAYARKKLRAATAST